MVTLTHDFQSEKADGTDTTLVKPSNWNAEHKFETAQEAVFLGRAAGGGPGPVQELPLASITMPTGVMLLYPGTAAPVGWMLCQGQSLVRADYPVLFAILGTYYGNVDGSTFNLPDMRGRVAAGIDPGVGRLTAASVVNPHLPGGSGGQETESTFADVAVNGAMTGATEFGNQLNVHVWGATSTENGSLGTVGSGPAIGSHNHSIDINGLTSGQMNVTVNGTLNGGGYTRTITNVQPTLMVNYIIKVV